MRVHTSASNFRLKLAPVPISGCRTSVRLVLSFQAMASSPTGAGSFDAATAHQAIAAAVPPSPRPGGEDRPIGNACGLCLRVAGAHWPQSRWEDLIQKAETRSRIKSMAAVRSGSDPADLIPKTVESKVETSVRWVNVEKPMSIPEFQSESKTKQNQSRSAACRYGTGLAATCPPCESIAKAYIAKQSKASTSYHSKAKQS